jgi:hypothetical protein
VSSPQKPQRFVRDPVLGKIEQDAVVLEREFLEAIRVLREEIAHLRVFLRVIVGRKFLPGGGRDGRAHALRAKAIKAAAQRVFLCRNRGRALAAVAI